MKLCQTCCWWQPNIEKPAEETPDGKYPCNNPDVGIRTPIGFGCTLHLSPDATEMNVPNHTKNGTMTEPNPNPVDGPCEIMIVTYRKDFPWLAYALKCINKYCSGFAGVTLAIPRDDVSSLLNLCAPSDTPSLSVHYYDEVPGKGMLQHMVKMAEADLIVSPRTKYVLHMDADCMFKMPTKPEHYFWNDKPYYLIRPWSSLGYPDPRHPISRTISDCAQWKAATDTQLGWDTEFYTMCMNTAVMPIEFYAPYREYIAKVHKRPFEDHMLAGRNEFPQTSMDWTAMGAWAHKFMHDRFTWFNCENPATNPYPADRKKAYHSHTGYNRDPNKGPIGFLPEIQAEIEGFLK